MSSDSQFQKKSTLENARVQFETVDVIPKKKKKENQYNLMSHLSFRNLLISHILENTNY